MRCCVLLGICEDGGFLAVPEHSVGECLLCDFCRRQTDVRTRKVWVSSASWSQRAQLLVLGVFTADAVECL